MSSCPHATDMLTHPICQCVEREPYGPDYIVAFRSPYLIQDQVMGLDCLKTYGFSVVHTALPRCSPTSLREEMTNP